MKINKIVQLDTKNYICEIYSSIYIRQPPIIFFGKIYNIQIKEVVNFAEVLKKEYYTLANILALETSNFLQKLNFYIIKLKELDNGLALCDIDFIYRKRYLKIIL